MSEASEASEVEPPDEAFCSSLGQLSSRSVMNWGLAAS